MQRGIGTAKGGAIHSQHCLARHPEMLLPTSTERIPKALDPEESVNHVGIDKALKFVMQRCSARLDLGQICASG